MKEKIRALLSKENFEIKENFSFTAYYSDVFAFRKGRNFVFPQRDYFFFHDIDGRKIDAGLAGTLHEEARKHVNSGYKMPKAFRFTVPNIASVFYSEGNISNEMIELASKNTRSVIGGEIQQIFFIDTGRKIFYSQGTNTVRAMVEGVSVRMKFSKIDPQNRAYYIIENLLR